MSNDHVDPTMRKALEMWLNALRGKHNAPPNGIERARDAIKVDGAMKIVDSLTKKAKDEGEKK
jgi:hypothetical protein